MSSCWRFSGQFKSILFGVATFYLVEVFGCATVASFEAGINSVTGAVSVPLLDGIPFADNTWGFYPGSESVSQVSDDTNTDGYTSYGDCLSCKAKYDCLNGQCILQSTYGTPGKYNSLADCQQECGMDDVKFNNIPVPIFSQCDTNGNPVNIQETISVIAGTEAAELLKFQQIADIQGEIQCSLNVSSVPDSWLIRPEHGRPQAIYQFAQVDSSGAIIGSPKYQINVPHHLLDQPTLPLPNYQKGNWQTIFVLSDNSKVTLFTADEANANLLLNAIKLRIEPSYLINSYLSRSCPVVANRSLPQITVKNRLAKYYSQGAFSELPDWIIKW